jgi:hypothetical protein
MARFVATGAIDLKLCTFVQMKSQEKFLSNLILGLAAKHGKRVSV